MMVLNEEDEVLVAQRKAPGHPFDMAWAFPGGHLEFGETFEACAQREFEEECGILIDQKEFHYITTMNVLGVEFNYHNVGIFMVRLCLFSHFNRLSKYRRRA